MCDHDLWVWPVFACSPGSNKDITVLKQIPLFSSVVRGEWLPRHCFFAVNVKWFLPVKPTGKDPVRKTQHRMWSDKKKRKNTNA